MYFPSPYVIIIILIAATFTSCETGSPTKATEADQNNDVGYYESEVVEDHYEEDEDDRFEDDVYSATVDYYNPETDYSATYTLDVEVVDNQVVTIYFPKGGYIDDDHISSAELDEDGFAVVDGEDGKTYEVQIDF